jgi:hypothetical protein
MWKIRTLMALGGLLLGAASLPVSAASAANSPTFRDCSAFVEGFDPDFVQLSGVRVSPSGSLSVSPSQNQVQLKASESSDPGDNLGRVTLDLTVTAPSVPPRTVSGAGTGFVVLSVPLVGSGVGRSYTISWSATFDNGNHPCPSPFTPDNTTPNPFVVTVSR